MPSRSDDASDANSTHTFKEIHVTTKESDQASTAKDERSDEFDGEHQPSPLTHGLMLLCLYIVMYLAVAALLHNVAPFSTALSTVGSSFADATRMLSEEPSEALPDFGNRSMEASKTAAIDINCD
jgi:hypothetical protein